MAIKSRLVVWTSDLPDPLETGIGIVAAVLISSIILFNSLTFVVFARSSALRQFGDFFILNLAVSNFAIGVLTIPVYFRAVLSEFQSAKLWHCLFWFTFEASAIGLAAYSMCIISIDRYLSVSRPSWYQRYKTDRLKTLMLLTPWLIAASVLLSFSLLFKFFVTKSRVVTDEACQLPYNISTAIFSFVSVVDFMVPFACLFVLNVVMYVNIPKLSQTRILSCEIKIQAPSIVINEGMSEDQAQNNELSSSIVINEGMSEDQAQNNELSSSVVINEGMSEDQAQNNELSSSVVINEGMSEDQAQNNELSSLNSHLVSSSLHPATCFSDTTFTASSTCYHSPEKNFGFSCLSFRLCPFANKCYPGFTSRHSGATEEDVSLGSSPTHETAAKKMDTSGGFLPNAVVGEGNVGSRRFLSNPVATKENVTSCKAKVSSVSFYPNEVDKEENIRAPSSFANLVAAKQSVTSSRLSVRFSSGGPFCAGSSHLQSLSVDASDTCELHRIHSKRSLRSCKKVATVELTVRKRKMAGSLFVLVLVFAFCWLPTEVLSLVQLACLTCIGHWVFYISFWLIRLNSALNPILYVVLHKRYRNALRNMLRKERKVIPARETI